MKYGWLLRWVTKAIFSQDVVEKARLKLIPFDQSRLKRKTKGVAKQVPSRGLNYG